MAWYVLFGTLAAFGALSMLWAALGWILPGGEGCALVVCGAPDIGVLSRWKWLRGLGLLRCPLIAVVEEAQPSMDEEIEQCSREALLFRLEMERNRSDGTGDGDPSGRYQRRGISEL